jgi:hypothetical protein
MDTKWLVHSDHVLKIAADLLCGLFGIAAICALLPIPAADGRTART